MAAALMTIGGLWDASIHVAFQHTIFALAHLTVGAAILLFGICGGLAWFKLRDAGGEVSRYVRVVFWSGIAAVVTVFVIDEAWHFLVSFDQTAWSPPHLVFWGTMLVELFGLAMLSLIHAQDTPFGFSWDLLFICSALLVILLFNLLEYDVPRASDGTALRPGFTYPLVGSFTVTIAVVSIAMIMRRPFGATLSACIAWVFFGVTGTVIEELLGFYYVVWPFPITIPALIADGWYLFHWKTRIPQGMPAFLAASFVVASLCYWAMVGWAVFVTQLPHQLPGTFQQWLQWYALLVPASALLAGSATWHIARAVCRIRHVSAHD